MRIQSKNEAYGGFLISKNVMLGIPVRHSFREKSTIESLNGWNLYSANDDDEYVSNPDNFIIVSAETIFTIAPVILEIFEAPYGTDLCWLYEDDVHVGFYDLISDKEVDISEIVSEST